MKVPALIVAGVTALALSLTGCANLAEQAAEKAVEGALSSEGANVDIEDGKVKIDSSEGSMEIGDGSSLPEGWPSDVPAPEGFTLEGSMSADGGDGQSFTASFTADGDQTKALEEYVSSLEGDGWKKETAMSGLYSLTKGTSQVDIIGGFADGSTGIVINVAPKAG